MKICTECGFENKDETVVCELCGFQFENNASKSAEAVFGMILLKNQKNENTSDKLMQEETTSVVSETQTETTAVSDERVSESKTAVTGENTESTNTRANKINAVDLLGMNLGEIKELCDDDYLIYDGGGNHEGPCFVVTSSAISDCECIFTDKGNGKPSDSDYPLMIEVNGSGFINDDIYAGIRISELYSCVYEDMFIPQEIYNYPEIYIPSFDGNKYTLFMKLENTGNFYDDIAGNGSSDIKIDDKVVKYLSECNAYISRITVRNNTYNDYEEETVQEVSNEYISLDSNGILLADVSLLGLSRSELSEKLGINVPEPSDFSWWGTDLRNIDCTYNDIGLCFMFQYDKLVMIIYDVKEPFSEAKFSDAQKALGSGYLSGNDSGKIDISQSAYYEMIGDFYAETGEIVCHQRYINANIIP